MKAPFCFDLRTQLLDPRRMANQDPLLSLASVEAMKLNERGFLITSVSGTAIAGTRTDDDTFTRSAGYWVDEVKIDHGGYTGTPVLGEEVEETTSGAKGYLKEITDTHIIIRGPITVAAFVGDKVLTGGTSGFTCTGDGTIVTDVTNLRGQWVYSHASGDLTDGVWLQVLSNTSTTIDVDGTLHATGTAVILCTSASAARDAIDMNSNVGEYSPVEVIVAAAATTIPDTIGRHLFVQMDGTGAVVPMTMPDARKLQPKTQIHFYAKNVDNAVTIVGFNTLQTLDDVDIKTTPFADLDAAQDHIIIELNADYTWSTTYDGIAP